MAGTSRPLAVTERGRAGAATIVFLHGGGLPGWTWEPVVARLPEYCCLVPDLPSHGGSRGVQWESLPATAALVAALIRERAAGSRAHLVGVSLGGQLALQLLATEPALIDRAVVSGTSVRPMPAAGFLSWLVRVSLPWSRSEWMVRANLRSLGIPTEHLGRYRQTLDETDPVALGRVVGDSLRFRPRPIASGANLLVAAGRKEPGTIYRSARDLVSTVPGVTLRMAPTGGHAWFIQTPELFARMVRAWVNQEPLPPELLPFPD
jgi:pimeloyl-ACP methyl ester carboxylesterase